MAIRYSGDVEFRISRAGFFRASFAMSVRWPSGRAKFPAAFAIGALPERYDRMALEAARELRKKHPRLPLEYDAKGQIVIRRVFQAPCPCDHKPHARKSSKSRKAW